MRRKAPLVTRLAGNPAYATKRFFQLARYLKNRCVGGRRRYFAFAPSNMGMVSRSLSDFTMSCVVVLYFLKCAVSRWDLYASTSAYISNTNTCDGFSLSATEYNASTPGSSRTAASICSLTAAL